MVNNDLYIKSVSITNSTERLNLYDQQTENQIFWIKLHLKKNPRGHHYFKQTYIIIFGWLVGYDIF